MQKRSWKDNPKKNPLVRRKRPDSSTRVVRGKTQLGYADSLGKFILKYWHKVSPFASKSKYVPHQGKQEAKRRAGRAK